MTHSHSANSALLCGRRALGFQLSAYAMGMENTNVERKRWLDVAQSPVLFLLNLAPVPPPPLPLLHLYSPTLLFSLYVYHSLNFFLTPSLSLSFPPSLFFLLPLCCPQPPHFIFKAMPGNFAHWQLQIAGNCLTNLIVISQKSCKVISIYDLRYLQCFWTPQANM